MYSSKQCAIDVESENVDVTYDFMMISVHIVLVFLAKRIFLFRTYHIISHASQGVLRPGGCHKKVIAQLTSIPRHGDKKCSPGYPMILRGLKYLK